MRRQSELNLIHLFHERVLLGLGRGKGERPEKKISGKKIWIWRHFPTLFGGRINCSELSRQPEQSLRSGQLRYMDNEISRGIEEILIYFSDANS